jgi:hypothetical protein
LRYEAFTTPYERSMAKKAMKNTTNGKGGIKWWDFYFNLGLE